MKFSTNTLILIILFTLLIAVLMGLEEFFEGELSAVGVVEEVIVYLFILGILILTVVAPSYQTIQRFNEKLPWNKYMIRRALFELFLISGLSLLLGFIFGQFIHHFIDHELPTLVVITRTVLFLFIISSLIVGIVEFLLLSEDRNRLEALSQKLEKENIVSLYNVLKNQVNPHFLFNSLSILSSLIYFDTEKADRFIKEFTNIYRYVLDLKEEQLVPVSRELKFLKSYFFLQQIRFGENLKTDISFSQGIMQQLIPPLSLQIVCENAIKHNQISSAKPLHISLYHEGDYLLVKNNYQLRIDKQASTGMGLTNLMERYRILSDKKPRFELVEKEYIARLPLLNASI